MMAWLGQSCWRGKRASLTANTCGTGLPFTVWVSWKRLKGFRPGKRIAASATNTEPRTRGRRGPAVSAHRPALRDASPITIPIGRKTKPASDALKPRRTMRSKGNRNNTALNAP